MDTTYQVIDEDGNIVRVGQGIVRDDGMGNAVVEYDELCDLPVGAYTIHPGDINLDVRPNA